MGKHVYTQEERRAQFIKTGLAIAKKDGLNKLSISAVAEKHKITAPLVFHIFGTRDKFRAVILAEAKKQNVTLKGVDAAAPKRKLTAAQVNAIKRKAAAPKAANGGKLPQRGKKPVVAAPTKAGKFNTLPVPAGEAVDTNLSPKV